MIDLPPLDNPELKVSPYLDVRIRYERRLDRDFFEPKADNRSDFLTRCRPGVKLQYGKEWSGEFQYQLAHDEILRPGLTMSDEASDLNLAFVKFKDKNYEVTFGRQKINIGSERLIGSLEWAMVGRSFDGVRVTTKNWDAFAFKVGVAAPMPRKTKIVGGTYSSSLGLSSLIFKSDDQPAFPTDHWTLSHLYQKQFGKWAYDAEAAVQAGHMSGKKLQAWALHLAATYSFNKTTKGFLEFNAASGGSNADNVYTFDNLLPTNHKFYGSMDLQAWKNMQEIAFGVEHKFDAKLSGKANYRVFSLRDASDAWYGAGGGPNSGGLGTFVDPTGTSGRDIGNEFNLEFNYKQSATTTFSGGFGIFSPGGFVKKLNGGSANTQYWFYLMTQFKF